MLNFPDNPTVNQVFTAGSQTWIYDGAKWVAYGVAQGIYLPLTGGKLTGALNPAGGIIGVTDGSSAAPGMVGEVISATASGVAITPSGTSITLGSLSVPAGDWDIWAQVQITAGTGALTLATASLSTVAAALQTNSRVQLPCTLAASNNIYFGLPRLPVSLANATTYYVVANAQFPSGAPTGGATIYGRRVR